MLLPERHGRRGARVAVHHRPGSRMADGLEKNVSTPEVVVMGRLSADIYPTELRTSLRHQRSFIRYVGGFAGNVSTGLARLQVSTAIVTKVGNDGHAGFIRDFP